MTFSWLTDEMTREDALQMLRDLEPSKSERIAQLERTGFPGKFKPVEHMGLTLEKCSFEFEIEVRGIDTVKINSARLMFSLSNRRLVKL